MLFKLLHLARLCSVKAVLSAHDTVAQKNFDPVLPPLPEGIDSDLEEESVKIVRLVKNKEPLVRLKIRVSDPLTAGECVFSSEAVKGSMV